MPTKWLQERANGSKNEHGMPPRRAFCGIHGSHPRSPTQEVTIECSHPRDSEGHHTRDSPYKRLTIQWSRHTSESPYKTVIIQWSHLTRQSPCKAVTIQGSHLRESKDHHPRELPYKGVSIQVSHHTRESPYTAVIQGSQRVTI